MVVGERVGRAGGVDRLESFVTERQPGSGAAIHLDDVSKSYGSVVAVAGVTLEIPPGEFMILLGPSGSGKSTLLQLIAGFEQPQPGRIRIGGRPMDRVAPHKRNIGFVFQSYALFPHLTVADNIGFPLSVRSTGRADRRRRISAAAALVGLGDLLGRYPRELSGGQQQRVALARALVYEPPIVLLDEPLGALDRRLRTAMQLEIRKLQREVGCTMLYVTHDQEEAFTLADRVGIMNDARLSQIGTPKEIYEHPESRFVAEFVGDANLVTGTSEPDGAGQGVLRLASGLTLRCTGPAGASRRPGAVAVMRPEKVQILEADDDAAAHAGVQCADARVDDVLYLGEVTVYTVVCEALGNTAMKVRRHNRTQPGTFAPGQKVTLAWRPEDVWLLGEERADGD